jgi:hypothetical protein
MLPNQGYGHILHHVCGIDDYPELSCEEWLRLKVGSEGFGLLAQVHLVCGAAPASGLLDWVERGALQKVFPPPANTKRVAKGDGDSGLAASGLVQDLRGLRLMEGPCARARLACGRRRYSFPGPGPLMLKYKYEYWGACQRRNVACHRRATERTLLMIRPLLSYTLYICLLHIFVSAITNGPLPFGIATCTSMLWLLLV